MPPRKRSLTWLIEDQCSPANPRVPMVNDMIEILRASYEGNTSYYTK